MRRCPAPQSIKCSHRYYDRRQATLFGLIAGRRKVLRGIPGNRIISQRSMSLFIVSNSIYLMFVCFRPKDEMTHFLQSHSRAISHCQKLGTEYTPRRPLGFSAAGHHQRAKFMSAFATVEAVKPHDGLWSCFVRSPAGQSQESLVPKCPWRPRGKQPSCPCFAGVVFQNAGSLVPYPSDPFEAHCVGMDDYFSDRSTWRLNCVRSLPLACTSLRIVGCLNWPPSVTCALDRL
ncbi:hypothetical protein BJ166DRAFT_5868 [Pestalotiopsis sp. NC0098]|nr:hypothetical protein BJ166DRAFT_5868 [Pestalotiopsis sp. NC0098]